MEPHFIKKGTIIIQVHKRYTIMIPFLEEYPSLDEKDFATKLTQYKDFNIKARTHQATTPEELVQVADRLCNEELELSTYQTVIRNFLSNDTPYNGLLLFHGLGTGKTCSAITVAEEHRRFLKESGLKRYIYVLGGLNIQDNFKKQLFDPDQLTQNGTDWTYKGCVGNTLLREVNLLGSKKDIVERIEEVIQKQYRFMGYRKFANYVHQHRKALSELEHSMIIIDEVHNVKDETGKGFTPSKALDLVTKKTNVKLLLLSATPMFNDPGEIIWILNLLNRNDKRYELKESDIFKDGELRESEKHRFLNHVRGYVSYVKGENPFTFPYRIYPSYFSTSMKPTKAFSMFGDTEMQDMKTQVYSVALSPFQKAAYEKVLSVASSTKALSMGDSIPFLSVLNMTYPKGTTLEYMQKKDVYEYYPGSERCFDAAHLSKYSAKIAEICKQIQKAEGIVVVYSQLLEGGVIPVALALESMGIKNWYKPLFKGSVQKGPYSYCMLTGSPTLSPHPEEAIRIVNSPENMSGDKIKVVLITKAASEGVDLKNIRQIHIMDPWWNLNRVEQIIGRGIRLCSHKALPFEKRNAQIFLYTSYTGEVETVDHYMYRFAEQKAKKIGAITRLLKENAMDCVMNHPASMKVLTVPQTLSTGEKIEYQVGDMSLTVLCDFMDCDYACACEEKEAVIEPTLYNKTRTIEKIRNQFRNGYVYEKRELHRALNLFLPMSMDQLEEALTEMVDLKLDCWDMFHRKGYLVNHGTYYYFQPASLPETVPVYERRIPSYKVKHSIWMEPKEKRTYTNVDELLHTLKQNREQSKKEGTDWYGTAFAVRKRMPDIAKRHGFVYDDDVLDTCIFEHMIEMLNYKECVSLLQHGLKEFMDYLKPEGNLVHLWNHASIVTLFLKETWKEYEYKYVPKKIPRAAFGPVVGGITNKGEERVFKSKHMDDPSLSYGQVCKNAGLTSDLIPRIQYVLGDDYTGFTSKEICCELELLLRYLDKIKYKGKRWFLNALEVIENNDDTIINLIKKLKT
jgi:Helicase conserved C-terminal domain/Type III restriction enzyme, res subunit